MRKLIVSIFGALALCGCSSTTITETTYNADGSVASVKTTETSDSPIVVGLSNTKDKHLVAHIGGWYANIGVQPNSNSYGIGAGSLDNTYASIVAGADKGGADIAQYFPAIVDASKYSLSITKDGVRSEGNETKSATSVSETKEK